MTKFTENWARGLSPDEARAFLQSPLPVMQSGGPRREDIRVTLDEIPSFSVMAIVEERAAIETAKEFIVQMQRIDGSWFDVCEQTDRQKTTLGRAKQAMKKRHQANQKKPHLRKLGVRVVEPEEFRYPPGFAPEAFWFRLDFSGPKNPRDPGFEWAWNKPLLPVEEVISRDCHPSGLSDFRIDRDGYRYKDCGEEVLLSAIARNKDKIRETFGEPESQPELPDQFFNPPKVQNW